MRHRITGGYHRIALHKLYKRSNSRVLAGVICRIYIIKDIVSVFKNYSLTRRTFSTARATIDCQSHASSARSSISSVGRVRG